jgi:hypothetical protein
LDTLLDAARKLSARDEIVFCFVGGGSEFSKVEEFARTNQLENIRCMPYQPQAELSAVLSAADLHVVVMGEGYQGIVHPCKIYNILTIGLPFLYVGPAESHVGEIISRLPPENRAFSAQHGQVDLVVKSISDMAERFRVAQTLVCDHMSSESQTEVCATNSAPPALAHEFSSRTLLPRLIAQIELATGETMCVEQHSGIPGQGALVATGGARRETLCADSLASQARRTDIQ